jgi:hypothetical protein
MEFCVIQWNISYNSNILKIASLLKLHIKRRTLVQLQEVTRGHFEFLILELNPTDSCFSLNYRTPGHYEGKNRKLGVATFVFHGKIKRAELLERSLFPERALFCEMKFGNHSIKSLNFHSLTGVGYRHGKASNFASIADFLATNELDFFSCDANEPMIDSVDLSDVKFFDNGDKGNCAALLFGLHRVHLLSDSWRSFNASEKNPADIPPISYIINKKIKKRYDFIFAADHFTANNVRYLLHESQLATSDHALVIADFVLRMENAKNKKYL